MALEIERKFLVESGAEEIYKKTCRTNWEIEQGYLNHCSDKNTIRVRTVVPVNMAYLTVKSRNKGCVRNEFEYQIPFTDGEELLAMCKTTITKTRYMVIDSGFIIEVDEFSGDNEGLVVAEIEFKETDPRFKLSEEELQKLLPYWLGEEVTDEPKYYNSWLSQTPYKVWDE